MMNTRGLVELIVLNLGLEYGLLTEHTFSVMVLMCLFTTFMTCPLINWVGNHILSLSI
jgi:Kef-type K+ transport system membrane component KefB